MCVPLFTYNFASFCLWRNIQETCPGCIARYKGRFSPGRTVLPATSVCIGCRMFPNLTCMIRVDFHWAAASTNIGFRLFVCIEKHSRQTSSTPCRVQDALFSWVNCSVGVPSFGAPPSRPAVRPAPNCLWYVRHLGATNLNWISFVRSSKKLLVVRDRKRVRDDNVFLEKEKLLKTRKLEAV